MVKPTIHINGTSKEKLLTDYQLAAEALEVALRAVQAIEVNARDYYPQGPEAVRLALTEHSQRINTLAKLHDELTDIAIHISDQ